MIYTNKIKDAIKFAIETHEINQKQKRKGKDIPYITHPLTVGLILSQAGVSKDVVIAGILHDTIEDSVKEKKVTPEMLVEKFSENVADLVLSVTEQNKELSWEERKAEALEHIKTFSNESVMLKSADIIANGTEIIDDYAKEGDGLFKVFNAPKDKIVGHYIKAVTLLIEQYPESSLVDDLKFISKGLQSMNALYYAAKKAKSYVYLSDYTDDIQLECSVCGWKGTGKEAGGMDLGEQAGDICCPNCDKMVLVIDYYRSK